MRFVDGSFDPNPRATLGADVKVKVIDVDGAQVQLTLWDTAGQERFRTLTSAYFRGAHAVILMYDVTSKDSFTELRYWLEEVQTYHSRDDLVLMLVGNKIDKVGGEVGSVAVK